ncbi:MAG TPA: hypothetical protein DD416_06205 [Rhodobacteraceae bacterium]|nr:hypothetical protein [Paracoccaceae bacterium]
MWYVVAARPAGIAEEQPFGKALSRLHSGCCQAPGGSQVGAKALARCNCAAFIASVFWLK